MKKRNLKLFIIQDADRINSLGAIGIMRYISYNINSKKEAKNISDEQFEFLSLIFDDKKFEHNCVKTKNHYFKKIF